MQNIVLDTNALLMAISAKSDYHRAWMAFLEGRYTLCITNEIIEEYHEVIARNINLHLADTIVFIILSRSNVRKIDVHYRFNLITTDPDDNKFVDCAVAANAKFIVTEDHHFNILHSIPFPHIEVIDLQTFINIL